MHELSIVLSIVETVEAEVKRLGGQEVKKIELDIGDLAGIEFNSFDFAWPPATKNTMLEKADRKINHIPGIANCMECGIEFQKKNAFDPCPDCGNYLHSLKSGKEMKIRSILIN